MPSGQSSTPPFKICWDEVTWYSRLGAIVTFLGFIPALCFYVGLQYGELKREATSIPPMQYATSQVQLRFKNDVLYISGNGSEDVTGWTVKNVELGNIYKIEDAATSDDNIRMRILLDPGRTILIHPTGTAEANKIRAGLDIDLYGASGMWFDGATILLLDAHSDIRASVHIPTKLPISYVGAVKNIDDVFWRDDGHVFFVRISEEGTIRATTTVPSADPGTFNGIGGVVTRPTPEGGYTYAYYRDNKSVYFYSYYNGLGGEYNEINVVPGADTQSFQAVESTPDSYLDAKDKNHTYFRGKMRDF